MTEFQKFHQEKIKEPRQKKVTNKTIENHPNFEAEADPKIDPADNGQPNALRGGGRYGLRGLENNKKSTGAKASAKGKMAASAREEVKLDVNADKSQSGQDEEAGQ